MTFALMTLEQKRCIVCAQRPGMDGNPTISVKVDQVLGFVMVGPTGMSVGPCGQPARVTLLGDRAGK